MAGLDPRATMAAVLDGLPSSLVKALRTESRTTFPHDGGTKIDFLRFSLQPADGHPVSAQDLSTGLTVVKRSLSPMPIEERRRLLMRLKAKTRSRSETDADINFQIGVYAEDLAAWPADVVRLTLIEWADTHGFWPVWSELVDALTLKTRKRQALVDVLTIPASQSG